ncbi:MULTISPECIES: LEM-3-like GIY-YIG domain-containing protein [unclassified Gordonia (in: high G+C Gram-positive bacteria)]|uniref:LEM-3-like GIY-YIG domain-containing protein n=1 Tax=unclassified Gordonia (in: high G+C Gram-positive bacteria) TaxID=2657482 RepID=UPI000B16C50D|nr:MULTISPECIES: hypothetical protein [unclassified Gordonia (in: high G+C Gram-positive bacteria)]
MEARNRELDNDSFTLVDVAILILDAVTLLHSNGHELVRVLPGDSPSGLHWRVNVTTADNLIDEDGYLELRDWDNSFRYTSGDEFMIARTPVTKATTVERIADLILEDIPSTGLGSDPTYVSWYSQLMRLVHQHHAVPYAYGEEVRAGVSWDIGSNTDTHIEPPPQPPQTASDQTVAHPHVFSSHVAEQIGWYVYALRNPIDGRVFYIGKGKGNRVFAHAVQAQMAPGEDVVGSKIELINAIHAANRQVEAFIIRHGLATEGLAYEIEASVIDALRLIDPTLDNKLFGLTNKVLGHDVASRGLASVNVIASRYNAPRAPDITVPAILIKIPGLWTPTITPQALYDATRQSWRIGKRREDAKYAFAVSHGVVRAVYRIDDWQPAPESGPQRWRFNGQIDPELSGRYANSSVKHLFKPGQANPIQYLNC